MAYFSQSSSYFLKTYQGTGTLTTKEQSIKRLLPVLTATCVIGWYGFSHAGDGPKPQEKTAKRQAAAVFEGKTTLLRPEGYRKWVFVGSSLGLRYSPDAPKEAKPGNQFANVYVNPQSYDAFSKTGKFPDGTILILEILRAANKNEAGLQGTYQQKFVGLEAAVKDSKRFDEKWAYFSFDQPGGKLKDKAQPFPKQACWKCHAEKAETDNVFTQFYPVLRAASPKN